MSREGQKENADEESPQFQNLALWRHTDCTQAIYGIWTQTKPEFLIISFFFKRSETTHRRATSQPNTQRAPRAMPRAPTTSVALLLDVNQARVIDEVIAVA